MTLTDEIQDAAAVMVAIQRWAPDRQATRDARDAEILKRWQRGDTQVAIARAIGVDQSKISRTLTRLGAPPAVDRATPRNAEILDLWEQGLTQAEIAQRVAVSIRTVQSTLARTGAPGRRVSRAAEATADRERIVAELWPDLSLTRADIAAAVGIHPQAASGIARRLGLPPRPQGRRPRA